jgi:hypothetical protein
MDEVADYICSFYDNGTRIDWDDALYRVETAFDVDLPDNMLSPEIKAVKAAVRKYRSEQAI